MIKQEQHITPPMINVTINGIQCRVERHQSILSACRSEGVYIPALCYHPDLPAFGKCGLCVVEIDGSGIAYSCLQPVQENMIITTNSDKVVRKALSALLDFADMPFYPPSKDIEDIFVYFSKFADFTTLNSTFNNDLIVWDNISNTKNNNNKISSRKSNAKNTDNNKIKNNTVNGNIDNRINNKSNLNITIKNSNRNNNESNTNNAESNSKRKKLITSITNSISFDSKNCVSCDRCFRICTTMQNIGALNEDDDVKNLSLSECIECGQCITVCPTNALKEVNSIPPVLRAIASGTKLMIIQISEEVPLALQKPKEMIAAACKTIGFNFVIDGGLANDIHTILIGDRLIEEQKKKQISTLFSTNCPAWINFVEKSHPEIIPNLANVKSSHDMIGVLSKSLYLSNIVTSLKNTPPDIIPSASSDNNSNRGGLMNSSLLSETNSSNLGKCFTSNSINLSFSSTNNNNSNSSNNNNVNPYVRKKPSEIFVVSLVGCTAAKDEIKRMQIHGDVDAVLTTNEFLRLMKTMGIEWQNLRPMNLDTIFDFENLNLLNKNPSNNQTGISGSSKLFSVSGGLSESVLRYVYERVNNQKMKGNVNFKQFRNNFSLRKAKVEITKDMVLTVASCSGISHAKELIESGEYKKFNFVEVMACPGGCVSGGGQPKSNRQNLKAKMTEVYEKVDDLSSPLDNESVVFLFHLLSNYDSLNDNSCDQSKLNSIPKSIPPNSNKINHNNKNDSDNNNNDNIGNNNGTCIGGIISNIKQNQKLNKMCPLSNSSDFNRNPLLNTSNITANHSILTSSNKSNVNRGFSCSLRSPITKNLSRAVPNKAEGFHRTNSIRVKSSSNNLIFFSNSSNLANPTNTSNNNNVITIQLNPICQKSFLTHYEPHETAYLAQQRRMMQQPQYFMKEYEVASNPSSARSMCSSGHSSATSSAIYNGSNVGENGAKTPVKKMVDSFIKGIAEKVEMIAINPVSVSEILSKKLAIFIINSGEPSESYLDCCHLYEELRDSYDDLSDVRYAVCDLQNKKNNTKNLSKLGRQVDMTLEHHLGQQMIPFVDVDIGSDDHGESAFERWSIAVCTILGVEVPKIKVSLLYKLKESKDKSIIDFPLRPKSFEIATLKQIRPLDDLAECYIYEYTIKLPEGTNYDTGNYVLVLPKNPTELVDKTMECLRLKGDETYRIVSNADLASFIPEQVSSRQLFEQYIDLSGAPTRQVIRMFRECLNNPSEETKKFFDDLLDVKNEETILKDFLKANLRLSDVICLLSQYGTPTVETILSSCPQIKPRTYSISSAPRMQRSAMTIIASIHTFPDPFKQNIEMKGLCSHFLLSSEKKKIAIKVTEGAFNYPSDPMTPIIMVALGPGIAPCKSILQHRRCNDGPFGPCFMFLGAKLRDVFKTIEDELLKDLEDGIIQKVVATYSREKDSKYKYVQDSMKEMGTEIWELFKDERTRVYYSGQFEKVPDQLREILTKITIEQGGLRDEEAMAYVDRHPFFVEVF